MDTYWLYWKTGEAEEIKGESIEKAFAIAGYSAGAFAALDFYDKNATQRYSFIKGNWRCLEEK